MFTEQLQPKLKTLKIKCILETEEEPELCDDNDENASSQAELSDYKEMDDSEIEQLYLFNFISNSNWTNSNAILIASHATRMYTFKYNVSYFESSQHLYIQEYEVTLNSNTLNNNLEVEKYIYVFRNAKVLFFWHEDIDYYKNLNQQLCPNNVNVIKWIHKLNYVRSISESDILKIYPGYNQEAFIQLFCRYLNVTDKILKAKLDMSKYDLLTVYLERTWLNDQIINKYLLLIKSKHNTQEKDRCIHVFDTFFWTRLKSHGYNQVKNDTKRIDIFSYEKLLIPINISHHWMLVGYDVLNKKIIYFDSVESSKKARMEYISKVVGRYLESEHLTKKGYVLNTDQLHYVDGNSPFQNNSYDCGVFTCINAELFSKGIPSDNMFDHTHINLYRQRIVSELLSKKLMIQ